MRDGNEQQGGAWSAPDPRKATAGTCSYIQLISYLTRALEQQENVGQKSRPPFQDVEVKVAGSIIERAVPFSHLQSNDNDGFNTKYLF